MPTVTFRSLLSATELPRAGLEWTSLITSAPWLMWAPRGEPHPVVVLPGFLASDDSTWVLREFLSRRGYQVYPWGQGRNLGATRMGGYQALTEYVAELQQRYRQKVSLVGWSLGGVHALAVANKLPEGVRQVITLGSPLGHFRADTGLQQALRLTARRLNGVPVYTPATESPNWHDDVDHIDPAIPISAIFSRTDGVVPWQRARVNPAPKRENIEVISSHIGMGINPSVLYAIADRLALPEQQFDPFHRDGWRAAVYPRPRV